MFTDLVLGDGTFHEDPIPRPRGVVTYEKKVPLEDAGPVVAAFLAQLERIDGAAPGPYGTSGVTVTASLGYAGDPRLVRVGVHLSQEQARALSELR